MLVDKDVDIKFQPISYKDSAAFVVEQRNGYYRYINNEYAKEFDHFINSGLYQSLLEKRLILNFEEVTLNKESSSIYKILFPEQIPFISYPFEWTFSQWQLMAITYLSINETALQHGMILKDASPYNFAFYKGECLLIDTTSFNFYYDGLPWIAYRQFCEELLSPLLLMKYKGYLWARLYRSHISGLPLSFVSRQLPLKTWLDATCLLHIHGHAMFQAKKTGTINIKSHFTKPKQITLLQLLKKNIATFSYSLNNKSTWNNYYEDGIEDERYLINKTTIVTAWLTELSPKTVIDLGANSGKFSFIAANICEQVLAIESDIGCLEKMQLQIQQLDIRNITTIVADISEPSPGLGWLNAEKKALLKRLKGDMVMMLALVHHLCIAKNVPLSFIAELAASITTNYVIVEFIPKQDSKVKLLLQNREDIFKNYTEENFIKNFTKYFTLINVNDCEASSRKLFLWQKN